MSILLFYGSSGASGGATRYWPLLALTSEGGGVTPTPEPEPEPSPTPAPSSGGSGGLFRPKGKKTDRGSPYRPQYRTHRFQTDDERRRTELADAAEAAAEELAATQSAPDTDPAPLRGRIDRIAAEAAGAREALAAKARERAAAEKAALQAQAGEDEAIAILLLTM